MRVRAQAHLVELVEALVLDPGVDDVLREHPALDQVFVVDSFSTDRTLDIARGMGAEVVQNPWRGYAAQKNWALDSLTFRNDWVFVLDADELLSDELKQEVAEILADGVSCSGRVPCAARCGFAK